MAEEQKNQLADIVTPNKAFVTKEAPYFGVRCLPFDLSALFCCCQSVIAALRVPRGSPCLPSTPVPPPLPPFWAWRFAQGEAVLADGTIGNISINDYKGKWLVLFSYPLDFTFVCPTEIIDYSNHYEEFKKIDCEVVAFSVDSIFTHLAWVNTPRKAGGVGSLNIPLLSDDTHQISRDYGVLQAQGANLRGLWIIDPNGVIRHITLNDPPVGRNPKETLRLVQAFQFVEKHGEVCPSGWTPGAESMKADPQGSKAYFEKVNQE